MAFAQLIAFHRPLAGAALRGSTGRTITEVELAAKLQEAYRQGVDAARASADQQMVEARAELADLSEGVLHKLTALEPALLAQVRDALPGLAVEISKRLLVGYEPPAEMVARLCHDALEQLFPERDGLELSLCPRDAALLTSLNPDWLARYPGIVVRPDATLVPGDCLVRSRFGLTDARQATKLDALAHSLTGT
jgi:flagellar assembly protein FliH